MDSITQGLLGGAIAEAGFRRRLGGRSVAWAAFCGVAPDFDFIAAIGGEWATVVHHRGISHSLIALTCVAPLMGWAARRWIGRGQGTLFDWIHLTFWALITHPLLDVCTAYGTQLLAPISTERFAIDAVSIVDPAYSVPLLIAVILAARKKADRVRSQRVAIGMLALTTGYLALGYVQSQRVIARANEDLAAHGFTPTETRAMPTLLNGLVFRVVARDEDRRFRIGMTSVTAPRPFVWHEVEEDPDPLVEIARNTDEGRIFTWSAMSMDSADVIHEDIGFTVRISDLRYDLVADPAHVLWGADARFDEDHNLVEVVRWQNRSVRDLGGEFSALWAYIVGDPVTR